MMTLSERSMAIKHEQIAAEINAEHERAFGKARDALEYARRAGELLLEAKATIGYGNWLCWVRDNCRFSIRTVQGYMHLAKHWRDIETKSATVAHLTLRQALAYVSAPPRRLTVASMRRRVEGLQAAATKIARNSDAPSAADAREIDAFFLQARDVSARLEAALHNSALYKAAF
jgi:hypothetical protein